MIKRALLTITIPIKQFFDTHNIDRSELARQLGVNRQRFTSWQEKDDYQIEVNYKSKKITVVRVKKDICSCSIDSIS